MHFPCVGGWFGNAASADDALVVKLQDKNLQFSMVKFLTSCEQSLQTIELLFLMKMLVILLQEKSHSNPQKKELIAEFSLSTFFCFSVFFYHGGSC